MKKYIITIVIILAFVCVSKAQSIRTSDIDKIAYEEMIRQELPGLAVGVYQAGRISYTKGYGYLDINRTKKITNRTPLRWASISKTLTAAAIFQLDENKKDFGFNDKVVKHFPYWITPYSNISSFRPGNYRPVPNFDWKKNNSIRQLLRHESGVDQYGSKVWSYQRKYKSDRDKFNAKSAVDAFKYNSLNSKPGSNYLYTTQGYVLLGAVIDKYTGSYTNYTQKNIAKKLGMTTLKVSQGNSYGFQKNVDGIINSKTYKSTEWVLPGGGWESNVIDLLKFAKGIMNNQLLKNTSRLWRSDINQKYQGLESTGKGDEIRVWHGGSHPNLRTLMYIMPKKNIAVVVMIPVEYASTWNIVRKIVDKIGVDRSNVIKKRAKNKCTDDMKSSGKKFIGIWHKTNKDVIIRRGYTSNNFNKEWNFLKQYGYQAFDIEAYNQGGKLLWDGVFKKAGKGYAMWRNYDYEGFKTKFNQMTAQGYRLYDLETYTVAGKRKWAGLFKKSNERYALHRNLSTEDFKKIRNKRSKEGRKLVDIEVYEHRGQLKWSGVWLGLGKEMLNRNYDRAAFYKLNDSRKRSSYKLTDVEIYKVKGKEKWAGIWEKSTHSTQFKRLSFCDFMDTHDSYDSKKYELIDLESY